jgi:hypothetical protein
MRGSKKRRPQDNGQHEEGTKQAKSVKCLLMVFAYIRREKAEGMSRCVFRVTVHAPQRKEDIRRDQV